MMILVLLCFSGLLSTAALRDRRYPDVKEVIDTWMGTCHAKNLPGFVRVTLGIQLDNDFEFSKYHALGGKLLRENHYLSRFADENPNITLKGLIDLWKRDEPDLTDVIDFIWAVAVQELYVYFIGAAHQIQQQYECVRNPSCKGTYQVAGSITEKDAVVMLADYRKRLDRVVHNFGNETMKSIEELINDLDNSKLLNLKYDHAYVKKLYRNWMNKCEHQVNSSMETTQVPHEENQE